jgi:hypothetical protein
MKANSSRFVSDYVIALLFGVVVPSSHRAIISVSALMVLAGLGGGLFQRAARGNPRRLYRGKLSTTNSSTRAL